MGTVEPVATRFAVVYCRVSSAKQTKVGDGLQSQKTRCEEFARSRGYEVVATFVDDISGSALERRGMKEMLAYLVAHRKRKTMVLIDDISRLARNVETHGKLRQAIAAAGGILQSPSHEFGDDSDARLIEYIMATVSEYHRGKNGRSYPEPDAVAGYEWILALYETYWLQAL